MGAFQEIPAEFCTPIRDSANRPHLLFGCEPHLFMAAALLSVFCFLSILNWKGLLLGAVVFGCCIQVFRAIAKHDPVWVRVWLDKKNWLQDYYPALHAPPRRKTNVP
jgi:type IV secretory pathway TrbD component